LKKIKTRMAVLHRKEEKIQVVLGRLPKKYTDEQFVEMFIKLYSKDWGKIKSAYIKQSQDKEPGTVINMPKPDLYLKQVLTSFLQQNTTATVETAPEIVDAEPSIVVAKKPKAPAKKKVEVAEEAVVVVKKPKAVAKKKTEVVEETSKAPKKTKPAVKKSI
jgi:hypothetical protein